MTLVRIIYVQGMDPFFKVYSKKFIIQSKTMASIKE